MNQTFSGTLPDFPANYKPQKESALVPALVSVNDEVIWLYTKLFGLPVDTTRESLLKQGKAILPLYQQYIASGEYPPFDFGETEKTTARPTEGIKLRNAIAEQSGYNKNTIWNYLIALQMLSENGIIELKHYDPEMKDLKTLTETHFELPSVPEVFKAADKATNKLLIAGGIGLAIYGLFYINKITPRRRAKA